MELEPHALLRINAHEEIFLPVEVRVEWLSKQAALRMRASAMVGNRISQLDDAIRARALLSIVQLPATTAAGGGQKSEAAHDTSSAAAAEVGETGAPRPEGDEGGVAEAGQGEEQQHVRRGSSEPPLDARDLEVVARMAVAKVKIVLFQLASPEEKKERLQQGKDVFDVYEGLLTSEDLEQAAKEGFPKLDVDTLLDPKHFRYRSLIAARHRYLLRKLAVLLDLDEGGLDSLLDRAADTEKLRDSLADVDLSLDDEEQEARDAEDGSSPALEPDARQQKEENARGRSSSRSSSSSQSAAASALMSTADSGAAAAPTAAAAASAVGKSSTLKISSSLRSSSWERDAGSDDTTEGETDEETMTPHAAHRRDVSEVSPSH
ncbi:unnamed protein product [Scytosiphon promiscuus]